MASAPSHALKTALAAMRCDVILADNAINPSKIGFFNQNQLLEVWHQQDEGLMGRIVWARIIHIFPQHHRAALRLPDGLEASMRLPSSARLIAGQMVVVTITAEAYADKPAAAILGAEMAGALTILKLGGRGEIRSSHKSRTADDNANTQILEALEACQKQLPDGTDIIVRRRGQTVEIDDVIAEISDATDRANAAWQEVQVKASEPKLIDKGLPATTKAVMHAPDAKQVFDASHSHWDLLAEQAEAACGEAVFTHSGICLWFHQTRAVMAVDVDSASSNLSPEALAGEACIAFMQQVRLRQLGGNIIFDLPRMGRAGRAEALAYLNALAELDPRHPDILGFGPAGMIEMRIRHGRTPHHDVKAVAEIL